MLPPPPLKYYSILYYKSREMSRKGAKLADIPEDLLLFSSRP
jgi:hypothetical protein